MNIGQLVKELKKSFPSVTISRIRFLEKEGLIKPKRSSGGTRIFTEKDLKKLNRLKVQLDRLNAIGGLDSIVPSEGIVFKYKGNTYKFTGAFAPINQITGLITF